MRLKTEPTFKKRLKKKHPQLQRAVAECLRRLVDDPNDPGLNIHPVQGHKGVWEAYIDQGNRVTFEYDGDCIVMRNHCNHDVLRRP